MGGSRGIEEHQEASGGEAELQRGRDAGEAVEAEESARSVFRSDCPSARLPVRPSRTADGGVSEA